MDQKVGGSIPIQCSYCTCRSDLGQDTGTQIASEGQQMNRVGQPLLAMGECESVSKALRVVMKTCKCYIGTFTFSQQSEFTETLSLPFFCLFIQS